MIIHRIFRYRAYPMPEQIERLSAWDDSLRFLWNLGHEQRLMGIARVDKHYPTAFDQQKELTELRDMLPWLADVPRNVSSQLLVELDKAWQLFFKKIARMPRWKSKNRDRLSFTEAHAKRWYLDGNVLHFPKLGPMEIVLHRPLEGKPKTCTLKRDGDQWFVSIVCEIEIEARAAPLGAPVGIDRGITNILADSNGQLLPGPLTSPLLDRQIRRAQRVLSRRKRGSKNREKARLRVARLYRKTRRQRGHILHVESSRYAKNHGVIVLEDLKLQNMTRSAVGTIEKPGKNVETKKKMNRAIRAAGWGMFENMLVYKSVRNSSSVEKVIAAYSSQTCAACGHVDAASRRGEKFKCVSCGHRDHADVNAAKVLLSRRVDGGAVCGGSAEVGRPVKQKLHVARRGTRQGILKAHLSRLH